MAKGGKAPKAPDYTKLAQEQARLQNEQLALQTTANRPDQVGPLGSVKWTQDENGNWTQTETLDPRLQELMDQSLGMQGDQMTMIQNLQSRGPFSGGPTMPTYDQASGDAYSKTFTDSLLARVRPQQQIDQQAMETKLRLRGLQPGTEAYDRAYRNLLTSQGDVTAQAELQGLLAGSKEARDIYAAQLAGQGQGYQQELQNYLLPYQTAGMTQSMVGASGVQMPDYEQFHGAGVGQGANVLDSAQQQYAQQMQQYNEKKQSKQAKGQSIGSVVGGIAGSFFGPVGTYAGSALGGAAGGALSSDIQLKDEVAEISDEACYEQMKQMLPISWRWAGTSVLDEGISAQQVLELAPELVERGAKGLLKVNYTALFARLLGAFRHMAKLQEMEARRGAAA